MLAKRFLLILSIFSLLEAAVAFQQSPIPGVKSQSSRDSSAANSAQAGAASAPDLVGSQLVGQWVALNRSKGGIGSIWEFKADGTFTMSPGAVVDLRYRLEGETLTLSTPGAEPDLRPQVFKIRLDGDRLYQRAPETPGEVPWVRVKSGRPGDAPIIGQWKVDPSLASRQKENPPSLDWDKLKISPEAYSKLTAAVINNTTYTFTRDGICLLRIGFSSVTGRYDVSNRTFSLDLPNGLPNEKGQPKTFTGHFELRNGELYLTQPDGHTQDVYIRDDPESTHEPSREKLPQN